MTVKLRGWQDLIDQPNPMLAMIQKELSLGDTPIKYIGKRTFRRVIVWTGAGAPPQSWMNGATMVWLPKGWQHR